MPDSPVPDFRALHQRGNPCIMVNVRDRGTARRMQGWGAQARATHLLMKEVAQDMFSDGRFDRLSHVLARSETDMVLER